MEKSRRGRNQRNIQFKYLSPYNQHLMNYPNHSAAASGQSYNFKLSQPNQAFTATWASFPHRTDGIKELDRCVQQQLASNELAKNKFNEMMNQAMLINVKTRKKRLDNPRSKSTPPPRSNPAQTKVSAKHQPAHPGFHARGYIPNKSFKSPIARERKQLYVAKQVKVDLNSKPQRILKGCRPKINGQPSLRQLSRDHKHLKNFISSYYSQKLGCADVTAPIVSSAKKHMKERVTQLSALYDIKKFHTRDDIKHNPWVKRFWETNNISLRRRHLPTKGRKSTKNHERVKRSLKPFSLEPSDRGDNSTKCVSFNINKPVENNGTIETLGRQPSYPDALSVKMKTLLETDEYESIIQSEVSNDYSEIAFTADQSVDIGISYPLCSAHIGMQSTGKCEYNNGSTVSNVDINHSEELSTYGECEGDARFFTCNDEEDALENYRELQTSNVISDPKFNSVNNGKRNKITPSHSRIKPSALRVRSSLATETSLDCQPLLDSTHSTPRQVSNRNKAVKSSLSDTALHTPFEDWYPDSAVKYGPSIPTPSLNETDQVCLSKSIEVLVDVHRSADEDDTLLAQKSPLDIPGLQLISNVCSRTVFQSGTSPIVLPSSGLRVGSSEAWAPADKYSPSIELLPMVCSKTASLSQIPLRILPKAINDEFSPTSDSFLGTASFSKGGVCGHPSNTVEPDESSVFETAIGNVELAHCSEHVVEANGRAGSASMQDESLHYSIGLLSSESDTSTTEIVQKESLLDKEHLIIYESSAGGNAQKEHYSEHTVKPDSSVRKIEHNEMLQHVERPITPDIFARRAVNKEFLRYSECSNIADPETRRDLLDEQLHYSEHSNLSDASFTASADEPSCSDGSVGDTQQMLKDGENRQAHKSCRLVDSKERTLKNSFRTLGIGKHGMGREVGNIFDLILSAYTSSGLLKYINSRASINNVTKPYTLPIFDLDTTEHTQEVD